MVRRWVRYLAASGLIMAVVILVRRTMALREESEHVVPSPDRWTPIREADLVAVAADSDGKVAPPVPAASPGADPAMVAPDEDGADPAMVAPDEDGADPAWVAPNDDGEAPASHPIKAKTASHIYHLPGMANYGRTRPDRCYATEAAAEADGYVKAKR